MSAGRVSSAAMALTLSLRTSSSCNGPEFSGFRLSGQPSVVVGLRRIKICEASCCTIRTVQVTSWLRSKRTMCVFGLGGQQDKLLSISATLVSSAPALNEDLPGPFSGSASAKLTAIVGAGTLSPLNAAPWKEVMQHMARRLRWIDNGFEMLVISDDLLASTNTKEVESIIRDSNILVVVGVQQETSIAWLGELDGKIPTQISFESAPGLSTWLGGMKLQKLGAEGTVLKKISSRFETRKLAERRKILKLVEDSWERNSSDSFSFSLLVLINSYVVTVTLLKNLTATSFASIKCMMTNCGPQVLACYLDPNCRKALNCLSNCAPTDQVCSYRCIVSYESPKFEAFTLCILQKNNCLGLNADILMQPDVQPMANFRGQTLTHLLAEDIFIGWLGKLQWSWRVVAGQNAAYDHFPCQFQIFYRGKARGSLWYDPVFQVQTLDGQTVWRRRHYRVKRSVVPGTFFFTVLDNGVVSNEFWRIVDVNDDMSWALFYYSGAAKAAGQSYQGAVLCTPDGLWVKESEQQRLKDGLERCGIKVWELFRVNNSCCTNPPLGVPDGASLHSIEYSA